jgi:hypothetical protein
VSLDSYYKHFKNIVSKESIHHAMMQYRSLPNWVCTTDDGFYKERHNPSRGNGHLMYSHFDYSELSPICDEVVSWAEETLDMKFEVDLIRILKYAKSSFNGSHVDGVYKIKGQKDLDHKGLRSYQKILTNSGFNFVIGMTNVADFKGGELFVNDDNLEFDYGDICVLGENVPHGVREIKKGLRHSMNIRCRILSA